MGYRSPFATVKAMKFCKRAGCLNTQNELFSACHVLDTYSKFPRWVHVISIVAGNGNFVPNSFTDVTTVGIFCQCGVATKPVPIENPRRPGEMFRNHGVFLISIKVTMRHVVHKSHCFQYDCIVNVLHRPNVSPISIVQVGQSDRFSFISNHGVRWSITVRSKTRNVHFMKYVTSRKGGKLPNMLSLALMCFQRVGQSWLVLLGITFKVNFS
mmetsp:Transcript_26585/g.73360  ORF Transcript_26585/g.73360 Transcript_26585/m.73360 type:complete len:212 (+) Transcript_26585:2144-2779(+)